MSNPVKSLFFSWFTLTLVVLLGSGCRKEKRAEIKVPNQSFRIDDLHYDAGGNLHLTHESRIYRKSLDDWSVFSETNSSVPADADFTALADAGSKKVWFFSNQTLYELTDAGINVFSPPNNALSAYSSIAFNTAGQPHFVYWNQITPASSRLELAWYDGSELRLDQAPNLFTGSGTQPVIANIVEDGNGGFWICGDIYLYHYLNGVWTEEANPNFVRLREITRSADGTLWLTDESNSYSFHRYQNGIVTSFSTSVYPCLPGTPNGIHADDQNRVWFPNLVNTLVAFDGTECTEFPFPGFVTFNDLQVVNDIPHVATTGGIFRLNESTSTYIPVLNTP